MFSYTMPIQTAFIMFLVLGFLLIIPWLIYCYRKYGYLSIWTSIIVYSFIFYMLSALFLVLLPLPSTRDTCAFQAPDTVYYSIIPFYFVWDIVHGSAVIWSQPATYIQIIKESAFLQAVFNFLLLLPLGVYIRYYFQERYYWKRALLIGFTTSLFFEVTQLTGIYGLYTCPYRIFDVDDLLLNSSGALFGFLIGPVILALFPSKKKVLAKKDKILRKDIVLPIPQLLAIFIDFLLVHISWEILTGFFLTDHLIEVIYKTLVFFVVFFVVPVFWKGKTIGTTVMRYRLIDKKKRYPAWSLLLKRFIALYIPWVIYQGLKAVSLINLDMESAFYYYHVWISLAAFFFMLILWLVLFCHILMVVLKKGKRLFYFDDVADVTPTKKQEI
ncbi:VanZ family protein [Virgibacillus sp. M23]|uniref:VanZ family protein n=1 Tax=Virgibacillus sp. M23 TaxID=3079030 RepID=UPI002A908AFF|nr:VanZ family protein [Virgibacillus sp. M23]MDY7042633.1 VanZ family protein [Virgibacillus sp. M23]